MNNKQQKLATIHQNEDKLDNSSNQQSIVAPKISFKEYVAYKVYQKQLLEIESQKIQNLKQQYQNKPQQYASQQQYQMLKTNQNNSLQKTNQLMQSYYCGTEIGNNKINFKTLPHQINNQPQQQQYTPNALNRNYNVMEMPQENPQHTKSNFVLPLNRFKITNQIDKNIKQLSYATTMSSIDLNNNQLNQQQQQQQFHLQQQQPSYYINSKFKIKISQIQSTEQSIKSSSQISTQRQKYKNSRLARNIQSEYQLQQQHQSLSQSQYSKDFNSISNINIKHNTTQNGQETQQKIFEDSHQNSSQVEQEQLHILQGNVNNSNLKVRNQTAFVQPLTQGNNRLTQQSSRSLSNKEKNFKILNCCKSQQGQKPQKIKNNSFNQQEQQQYTSYQVKKDAQQQQQPQQSTILKPNQQEHCQLQQFSQLQNQFKSHKLKQIIDRQREEGHYFWNYEMPQNQKLAQDIVFSNSIPKYNFNKQDFLKTFQFQDVNVFRKYAKHLMRQQEAQIILESQPISPSLQQQQSSNNLQLIRNKCLGSQQEIEECNSPLSSYSHRSPRSPSSPTQRRLSVRIIDPNSHLFNFQNQEQSKQQQQTQNKLIQLKPMSPLQKQCSEESSDNEQQEQELQSKLQYQQQQKQKKLLLQQQLNQIQTTKLQRRQSALFVQISQQLQTVLNKHQCQPTQLLEIFRKKRRQQSKILVAQPIETEYIPKRLISFQNDLDKLIKNLRMEVQNDEECIAILTVNKLKLDDVLSFFNEFLHYIFMSDFGVTITSFLRLKLPSRLVELLWNKFKKIMKQSLYMDDVIEECNVQFQTKKKIIEDGLLLNEIGGSIGLHKVVVQILDNFELINPNQQIIKLRRQNFETHLIRNLLMALSEKEDSINFMRMREAHQKLEINFIDFYLMKLTIWQVFLHLNTNTKTIYKFLSQIEKFRFFVDVRAAVDQVIYDHDKISQIIVQLDFMFSQDPDLFRLFKHDEELQKSFAELLVHELILRKKFHFIPEIFLQELHMTGLQFEKITNCMQTVIKLFGLDQIIFHDIRIKVQKLRQRAGLHDSLLDRLGGPEALKKLIVEISNACSNNFVFDMFLKEFPEEKVNLILQNNNNNNNTNNLNCNSSNKSVLGNQTNQSFLGTGLQMLEFFLLCYLSKYDCYSNQDYQASIQVYKVGKKVPLQWLKAIEIALNNMKYDKEFIQEFVNYIEPEFITLFQINTDPIEN